ncbi:MAG: hypothetical protein MUO75_00760 [Actinobacteria bacterium]|nr:hypothetical protein [Actinomycetota bacterium]
MINRFRADREAGMLGADAASNDFTPVSRRDRRPVDLEFLDNIAADPIVLLRSLRLKPGTLPGHGVAQHGPRLSTVPQITTIDPGCITTDLTGDGAFMPSQVPGDLTHRFALTAHDRNPFPLPHRELKVMVFYACIS